MIVPTHAFREYDIRGVADRDLTDDVARGIGQGFATMLGAGERPVRVAVGRDCRLSSDRLFAALAAGLTKAGADVVEVGIGPTPDALRLGPRPRDVRRRHDHRQPQRRATRTASR